MKQAKVALEQIPVLLYHRLAPCPSNALTVTPDLFGEQLDIRCLRGRMLVTVGEIAAALRGEPHLPERPVAITFDDGSDETPATVGHLAEHRLCATVCVTAGLLDQPHELMIAQLGELAVSRAAVEIGARTTSHPRLDELSTGRVRFELASGKQTFEDLLGTRVGSLAYPYGMYKRRVRAAVIEAGFSPAVVAKNAISHGGADPWAIAGYTITNATTPALPTHVFEGRRASYALERTQIRRRVHRGFRSARCQIAGHTSE